MARDHGVIFGYLLQDVSLKGWILKFVEQCLDEVWQRTGEWRRSQMVERSHQPRCRRRI
jgi:hypothetical protein